MMNYSLDKATPPPANTPALIGITRNKLKQPPLEPIISDPSISNSKPSNAKIDKTMTSATDQTAIFDRVIAQLKARLGQEVFSSWFARMECAEATRDVVRLSVPTAFLKSWINNYYVELIDELWRVDNPELKKLEIVVRSAMRMQAPAPADQANVPALEAKAPHSRPQATQEASFAGFAKQNEGLATREATNQPILGSPLDKRYTFDSFVEGSANRVAFAAAKSVSENDGGPVRFNPLFIHASVGQGKTHLLQAIASDALARAPGSRVVYLTAEYFMWRFATAIRDNHALTFKEQLRDIDLLVIDDMQFLQGKSIQHEFCHLINMLLDSARQVVVAADRPPSELESLEPRVRSRLQGGVALEISSPDIEMRHSILRQRLAAAQEEDASLDMPDDILFHVAKTITGSGRELDGAFNQLLFRRKFEPDMTIERVDAFLAQIYRGGEPRPVRIEDIQRIVAKHFNVSKQELLSARRTRTIVKPRQIAMYLAKTMTPRSLPEIGRRFGGRDHTTVLHAVRKIEGLIDNDNKLGQELELLQRLIDEQNV